MAFEWKFKPRPYTDDEAKKLLKDVISPETSDWHYNTHHKGYVAFLNKIEAGLVKADPERVMDPLGVDEYRYKNRQYSR